MIINSTGSNKYTIGETKEYKTTIDIENLDFIATLLSSNLYSNPEESFIREIVSNGWDSHVEAGTTDTPIIVRVKRNANYSYDITIRDYGTGLSQIEFENLFCKIGSSTKRESNAYHGCFGLGHLSPLAVSKVCYITSYYNDIARLYVMTKDGNNITTNLMSEQPTNEKNGLEITVKNIYNISTYDNAIKKLALFPNVYIDGVFSEYNNIQVKRFKYFTALSTQIKDKILLGNVLYPLNTNILPAELARFYNIVSDKGIVFNFNIGELVVTPNRESIIYNSKTSDLIINRIKEAYNEFVSIIEKKLPKDYDNPYEYYNAVYKQVGFNFIADSFIDKYSDLYSPIFRLDDFDFNITLKGKKYNKANLNVVARCENIIPNKRAVVSGWNQIWNNINKLPHDANRIVRNINTKILIIPSTTKLGVYVKEYLKEFYKNTVIVSSLTQQAFIQEYMDNTYTKTLSQDEEELLKLCYKHLVNRSSTLDLDTDKDYIDFSNSLKKERKENKETIKGKVILTLYKTNWPRRKEFKTYSDALTYIKGLNKGVIFRNLDAVGIHNICVPLNYVVIAAAKQTVEALKKENLRCAMTEEKVCNNKGLVLYKSYLNSKLVNILPNYEFTSTLSKDLKDFCREVALVKDKFIDCTYSISQMNLPTNEELINKCNKVAELYAIFKHFSDIVGSMGNNSLVSYILMKQKGYRINYDSYQKTKNNQLISLICKK